MGDDPSSEYGIQSERILDAIMLFRHVRDIFKPDSLVESESDVSVRYFISTSAYYHRKFESDSIKDEIYPVLMEIEKRLELSIPPKPKVR